MNDQVTNFHLAYLSILSNINYLIKVKRSKGNISNLHLHFKYNISNFLISVSARVGVWYIFSVTTLLNFLSAGKVLHSSILHCTKDA